MSYATVKYFQLVDSRNEPLQSNLITFS